MTVLVFYMTVLGLYMTVLVFYMPVLGFFMTFLRFYMTVLGLYMTVLGLYMTVLVFYMTVLGFYMTVMDFNFQEKYDQMKLTKYNVMPLTVIQKLQAPTQNSINILSNTHFKKKAENKWFTFSKVHSEGYKEV